MYMMCVLWLRTTMVTVTATGCQLWPIESKCCNKMYKYNITTWLCECVYDVYDVCSDDGVRLWWLWWLLDVNYDQKDVSVIITCMSMFLPPEYVTVYLMYMMCVWWWRTTMVTVMATGCQLWPIGGKCCRTCMSMISAPEYVNVYLMHMICFLMMAYDYGDCYGYWMSTMTNSL